MAKGTVTRKQLLKEPDQFITFSGKIIAFGRSHGRSILIGVSVIVALLLIFVVAGQISKRNELKASEQLEKVMNTYSVALTDTNPEKAYAKIKNDFTSFFDKYGSKASGKLALILYGDISYSAKDADTAIDMYDRALKAFGNTIALKNVLLSRLGHAYLLKDKNTEAIQTFETISESEETTMKAGALFNLALLYEASGNKEKSDELFKRLQTDFPTNIYNDLVREKISG